MNFAAQNSALKRCFYQLTKDLVENQKSPKAVWSYYLHVFMIVYVHRTFFISYIMYYDYDVTWYNFSKYDIMLSYLSHNRHLYDSFIPIIFYLFAVFFFFCEYSLYHLNSQTITWRWWHQLVVQNQDQYYDSQLSAGKLAKRQRRRENQIKNKINRKIEKFLPKFCVKIACEYLAKAHIWIKLDNVDKRTFFGRPLLILPNLSRKLRTRLILLLILADKFACFAQLIITLIVSLFIINVCVDIDFRPFRWYIIQWLFIEFYLVHYGLIRLVRSALFFSYCSIFGTIVYAGHVIDVGKLARRIILKYKILKQIPLRYYQIFHIQLHEHNKVVYLVICGSRELFGWALFAFLLTNIPINVYIIRRSVFITKRVQLIELATSWYVCFCQTLAASVVFVPLAWCCGVYHSPKMFIPTFQALTSGSGWLWYKVKYDDLYNRLLRGPKLALSIGPEKSITYLSALEFLFVYIGYILMAFSQQIEAGMQKQEID